MLNERTPSLPTTNLPCARNWPTRVNEVLPLNFPFELPQKPCVNAQKREGDVVAVTVTVKVHVARLPQRSTASHVTGVRPSPHGEPERGVQVTGMVPSQLSVAPTAKLTVATSWPDGAATVRFEQPEITGGIVSRTVIVCVHVLTFPAASVAL